MTHRKKLIEEIMANFHAMKNKMHARMLRLGNKHQITHSQLFVLSIIKEHHHIGIKALSKKFNISSSAATQLVDVLVENGYVIRKANSKDRRALHLTLSPKGRTCIVESKKRRMKRMMILFDALTIEELKQYLVLHKKIVANIKA